MRHGIGIGLPVVVAASALPLIASPLAIASCVGWFDATDLTKLSQDTAGATPVTTTADPVGRWMDKSGLNNHITQATGSAKPAWTTGVQNSLAGLSFDGGDGLDMTATYPSFPLTIIGVGKRSATVGAVQGLVTAYHSVNFGSRVSFSGANLINTTAATPSTSRLSVATFVANAPFVFGYRCNTTEIAAVANGVIVSTTHAAGVVTNLISIGRIVTNSFSQAWNGYMCEVCIWNRALTDLEITQASAYLNAKWGVF